MGNRHPARAVTITRVPHSTLKRNMQLFKPGVSTKTQSQNKGNLTLKNEERVDTLALLESRPKRKEGSYIYKLTQVEDEDNEEWYLLSWKAKDGWVSIWEQGACSSNAGSGTEGTEVRRKEKCVYKECEVAYIAQRLKLWTRAKFEVSKRSKTISAKGMDPLLDKPDSQGCENVESIWARTLQGVRE